MSQSPNGTQAISAYSTTAGAPARSTMAKVDPSTMPRRASGYERVGSRYYNALPISMTHPYAAGALLSTVDDLARWNAALFGGELLGEESLRAMTTAATLLVVARRLDPVQAPYTVELRAGPDDTLVIGTIGALTITSDGTAEFSGTADEDLRRYERVRVVDADGVLVLRGILEAQAAVPSPSSSP